MDTEISVLAESLYQKCTVVTMLPQLSGYLVEALCYKRRVFDSR
jgi:hypothetical protein